MEGLLSAPSADADNVVIIACNHKAEMIAGKKRFASDLPYFAIGGEQQQSDGRQCDRAFALFRRLFHCCAEGSYLLEAEPELPWAANQELNTLGRI